MRTGVGFAAALVLAAGCSSGGSGPSEQGATPVTDTRVTSEGLNASGVNYDLTHNEDRTVIRNTILAPLDSVWAELPGVFLELDIEPTTVDQQKHIIANTSFLVRRTLGGVQLNRYVNCGMDVMGPLAAHMNVTMSLVVQAVPDSAQVTTLRTQMTATGIEAASSSSRVDCASTGSLELRIARMVNDILAKKKKAKS